MTVTPSPFSAGAVIYAKDVGRLSSFYAEVIGLNIALEKPEFVVLESSHFQLVLHSIPQAIASTFEITNPPVRREDTAVKLVFPVSSIKTARVQARAFGGELNSPEREWQFQDCLVCDGHDPEGNVIQFRERTNAL
jgi:predicted enzyme related to lactoylglutathione lyase